MLDYKFQADDARKRFKEMLEKARNPRVAMERVAIMGWRDILTHFQQQRGPDGPWEPLARNRRRKGNPKKGLGHRILQDTGTLRSSIGWRTEGVDAVLFTNLEYADYHEHQLKDYKRPKRSFLWISNIAMKNILLYVAKVLTDK